MQVQARPDTHRPGAALSLWRLAALLVQAASAPSLTRFGRGLHQAAATGLALVLLAGAALAQPAPRPARDEAAVPRFAQLDSLEARVQGCATCHGHQGQGTSSDYFPRIAGKPALYLYNQLRAFHTGERRYQPMNYLLAYMTDDYLREIAAHFAALRPPFPDPVVSTLSAAQMERGRQLVQQGDAGRQLPPCIACHGVRLTGREPGIPGLAGLRPNYINAQLTRWRSGERRAASPDCMQRIASRLEESDIVAVSAWLAAQPAPQSPAPDHGLTSPRMPQACGSQP